MKCPKCGNENNDTAKFCKTCGESLTGPDTEIVKVESKKSNNKTIIIALIAIAIIALAGVAIYATGILNQGPSVENKDFGYFKMDVPVGSDFTLSEGAAKDSKHIALLYDNEGKYNDEVHSFAFGKGVDDAVKGQSPEKVEGDMKIYKKTSSGEYDGLLYEKGDYQLFILGNDVDLMKKMAQSLKLGNVSKLKPPSEETQATTTTTSATTSSPSTPSSISILGGSFSTGSAEEDKTYATINVGSQHAGENVIVQIFYSRDGNSLNNGNMVPVSVHSDGHIEVASADAYHYYPDYAKINIYDSNSHLLTSKGVSLSPQSGTQTF